MMGRSVSLTGDSSKGSGSTSNVNSSSTRTGGAGGSSMSSAINSKYTKDSDISAVENKPLEWPTLRHLEKQNEYDPAVTTPAPRCFWPRQQDGNAHMPLIPSTMPLRSDAFMGHWRDPAGDLDMQHVLEKYDADIGAAADSSHGDTEKTPVDMENYAVDECILRGHITIRSRYNSSDDNSDNDRNVDNDDSCDSDSSSVYEMPDDTIDELRMELYGCNMGEHIPQQPTTNKPSCAEADLRLELSLKDQELSELSSMVESLNAEMLVQRSELQSADIKLSHLETSVQCSICLEPFSQPHSLGCGHTFCMECLKQWLAQSMQCPTCRSSVLQRPSIAYIVQDVLQCLGLGSECRSSPVEVNRRGGGQDPWQQLFPSQSSGNASGSYERCRVCTRWTLRGGACPHCDLERIRRRLASSINVEGSTPRQSPAINMSRLVRQRSQVLASLDRLVVSSQGVVRGRNTAGSSRSERRNAVSPSTDQRMPSLLVLRGSELGTTRSQPPVESLLGHLEATLERATTTTQLPSPSRDSVTSTNERARLRQLQLSRDYASIDRREDTSSAGPERSSRDLSFYRNRYEESLLSPVSARASEFSLPEGDTRRSLREHSDAASLGQANDSFTPESLSRVRAQVHSVYNVQDEMSHNRSPNRRNHSISLRSLNPRIRTPSDYYVLRLDDNDSTTDEGESPAPLWFRQITPDEDAPPPPLWHRRS